MFGDNLDVLGLEVIEFFQSLDEYRINRHS